MTDNPLRSALSGLERKMILLIGDHQKLNEELKLLKSENQGLKNQVSQKSEMITDFQNKNKMSKIVNGMVVEENNTTELVDVINDYIREVDKCIAQLNE